MSTQAERDAVWEAARGVLDEEILVILEDLLGELPEASNGDPEIIYEGEPSSPPPASFDFTLNRRRRPSAPWQGTRIACSSSDLAIAAAENLEDHGWYTQVIHTPGGTK